MRCCRTSRQNREITKIKLRRKEKKTNIVTDTLFFLYDRTSLSWTKKETENKKNRHVPYWYWEWWTIAAAFNWILSLPTLRPTLLWRQVLTDCLGVPFQPGGIQANRFQTLLYGALRSSAVMVLEMKKKSEYSAIKQIHQMAHPEEVFNLFGHFIRSKVFG